MHSKVSLLTLPGKFDNKFLDLTLLTAATYTPWCSLASEHAEHLSQRFGLCAVARDATGQWFSDCSRIGGRAGNRCQEQEP